MKKINDNNQNDEFQCGFLVVVKVAADQRSWSTCLNIPAIVYAISERTGSVKFVSEYEILTQDNKKVISHQING